MARFRWKFGPGAVIAAAGIAIGAVAALVLALRMPESPSHTTETRQASRIPAAVVPLTRPAPRPEAPAQAAPDRPAAAAPAWLAYAVPSAPAHGRPVVAVVIDDMGLNRALSRRAVALKGPVTLSYLPYGEELAAQTEDARQRGHELLVHVSMAPEGQGADPGPNALVPSLAPAEIERRLDWALSRFSGYVGINNHEGSRFTADEPGMTVVLSRLKARGLLFLDSRTTPRTVGPAIARRLGLPFAERNVFLDNLDSVAAVQKQLAELETVARRDGAAIAIGHPREATLAALGPWLDALEAKGFVLVPLSAIVRRNVANGYARG